MLTFKSWVPFAVASMIIGGTVPLFTKMGLTGVSPSVALSVRIMFVAVFVGIYAAFTTTAKEFIAMSWVNWLCLAISALGAEFSWLFYYKALKLGKVSEIVPIEKCSVLVAILMAILFLGETLSWKTALGVLLIISGLLILATR